MFAPYLVLTNMEQLQISYQQALQFPKENNTYLYRWPLHLHKWMNTTLSLVNGTKIVVHFLTFQSQIVEDYIEDINTFQNLAQS